MYLLSSFKAKQLIGLDIHPEEIRLLGLKTSKNQIYIDKWMIQELPQGTICEGRIKNSTILTSALKQIVKMADIEGISVAIAVPFYGVINKRIKLVSWLKESDREREILTNLNHYLPGMSESLYIDFVTIRQIDGKYDEVLLVSARQEQINEYIDVVQDAGLNVKIVDIDSFAWLRAIKILYGNEIKNTIAILEVNFTYAQLIVFQETDMIFSQQWVIKGDELTRQLKNTIELFFSTHRHVQLTQIILWGKNEFLSELAAFIEKEFMLLSISAQPYFTELQNASSRMLGCYGLAIRGISNG